jgi:hypothetical protein
MTGCRPWTETEVRDIAESDELQEALGLIISTIEVAGLDTDARRHAVSLLANVLARELTESSLEGPQHDRRRSYIYNKLVDTIDLDAIVEPYFHPDRYTEEGRGRQGVTENLILAVDEADLMDLSDWHWEDREIGRDDSVQNHISQELGK